MSNPDRINFLPPQKVQLDYTNWRDDRSLRLVTPHDISYGTNEWHREPQWLMQAFDHDKNSMRTFALKDIHSWTENYNSK